jgi:ParB family chromosome partitioning protein
MVTATVTRRTTTKLIPIDRIDRDASQPRKHFDQAALEELANSLQKIGQKQSISVRYNPATRRYTLISGERRWRSARLAGLTDLHAIIEHGIDDPSAFAGAVAENCARVRMRPMEEANAFGRLRDEYGYTIAEIADIAGTTPETVRYRLDLLLMIAPLQEALNKGHLQLGAAWYVAQLSRDAQSRFLTKMVRGEFTTARDAEAFAQACRLRETNQQDDLFPVAEMADERKKFIATTRSGIDAKVGQLARSGQILADLAAIDVDDLAAALAGAPGGVSAYLMRIEHLQAAASKAVARLRKAKAAAAAATPDSIITAPDTLA